MVLALPLHTGQNQALFKSKRNLEFNPELFDIFPIRRIFRILKSVKDADKIFKLEIRKTENAKKSVNLLKRVDAIIDESQ